MSFNKLFSKAAVVVFGVLLFGQANAALIGVGASTPDFNFTNVTVSYTYNAGANQGTLQLTKALPNIGVQWKPDNSTTYTDAPSWVDGDAAEPWLFQLELSLNAIIDTVSETLISGTLVVNGLMNFGPYTITPVQNILTADLVQIGFDPGTQALDFLASVTGGNSQITALFGDVGVVANSAGFTSWTSDFTGNSQVDVTTPVPPSTSVPVSGGLVLLVAGIVGMRIARRR